MAKIGKRGRKAQPRARRKTLAPLKAAAPGKSGDAKLKQQLAEALAQQAATAEILKVISASPTDVQPVVDAIVQSAARLFAPWSVGILMRDGDKLTLNAMAGPLAAGARLDELRKLFPLPFNREFTAVRAIADCCVITLPDAQISGAPESGIRISKAVGYRAITMVPLVREDIGIGAIALAHPEPGHALTDKQLELVTTFADQAVIAIENVRLFNETREALERQTATSEILRVIAGSPTDVQPVFDVIVESAVRLCGARFGRVYRYDGSIIQMVASHGLSTNGLAQVQRVFPRPAADDTIVGRVILTRRPFYVRDIEREETVPALSRQMIEALGTRSQVTIPMLRAGEPIGVITMGWVGPEAFDDRQVSLLKTFADQAVIAIENARLFNETKEALERQTATAEILGVISSSPTDTQPVFDAIARSGMRLFDGFNVAILLRREAQFTLAAYSGLSGLGMDDLPAQVRTAPLDPEKNFPSRAILNGEVVHVTDWESDDVPEHEKFVAKAFGIRSGLVVPLLRKGEGIGAIAVARKLAGPFHDKDIALLQSFADQAVIAIENVRLFKELEARNSDLGEALEQQTATAEVLRAISSSPNDIQPILDTLVNAAARFCGAPDVLIARLDGDVLRIGAACGPTAAALAQREGGLQAIEIPLTRGSVSGRAVLDRGIVHVHDLAAEREDEYPVGRELQRRMGHRTMVAAPLLREGVPLGVIALVRTEVNPFSDKQLGLLRIFADQAVIAIENVRLFNETREALEQQKASADVLGAISGSITDTKPVFDKILESCERLFEGNVVGVTLATADGKIDLAAYHGRDYDKLKSVYPLPLSRESGSGAAILDAIVAHYPDIEAAGVPPGVTAGCRTIGMRAIFFAPMLFEGRGVGAIWVGRSIVGMFTEKQIALLKTFADQAVIAIQNARLFNETKEALELQTATAEILRVISSSPTDVGPVFDAILESACRLCDSQLAAVFRYDGTLLHLAATKNWPAEALASVATRWPMPPDPRMTSGRVALTGEVVREEDTLADPTYDHSTAQAGGWRRMIGVPMLREGVTIGVIVLTWHEPGPIAERLVPLLKTFADQAVIAIENVRLFNETKEALERQTATSEILKVISGSPTDTQPVFDAIVRNASRICNAGDAVLILRDGDEGQRVAHWGPIGTVAGGRFALSRETVIGRAILDSTTIHVDDLTSASGFPGGQRLAAEFGLRTALSIPLLQGGRAMGALAIRRTEVRPFSAEQIAMFQTFADQAVIAIENVRLFRELEARNRDVTEALEQQTATADILRVISSSPTNVQPVFDAIVQSGLRIFAGTSIGISIADGDSQLVVASGGNVTQIPPAIRVPRSRESATGMAVVERTVVNIRDTEAPDAPPSARDNGRALGFRAIAAVPLMREGEAIGAISLLQKDPGGLSDKQVALLRSFADQAVIAIENVRLFNETKEALERQTATAEILRVIGGSMTDTQPVFDAIVKNCGNLFDRSRVALWLIEEGRLHPRASNGVFTGESMPIDRGSAIGVCVLDGGMIHLPDLEKAAETYPRIRQLGLKFGYHSGIYAPLLREGKAIGGISVLRHELGAFDDKALALLNTFADQAVIAIENVRLFNETQEALERLTATSEVLRVISSSPTDVQPVFDSIAERAAVLCGARFCSLSRFDGETIHMAAVYGATPEGAGVIRAAYPMKPGSATLAARVIRDRKPLHIADVQADPEYEGKEAAAAVGFRSVLGVPMMREGHLAGAIVIGREQAGLFPDNQVKLLTTFADQAVIAIENVRLFHEIEEKGRQLEVASRHKSNFLSSMSHELRTPLNAILGFNEMILGQVYGEVPADMQEPLADIQTSGKHLLRLINNVLDLAKIEAGRMELSLQDYSVHDTVESVRSTLRPLAAEKGLEFLATVPNDVPLAYGDGGRIAQCLMNLAGNSLKFTKSGKVEISVETRGELLVYKVTDTGIGIPPDKIDSLFTEFKQTDATIASEYGGTGLGLSISKKFVEMHGGRVWVESELGKGSTFIIEIPLRMSEGKAA